MRKKELRSVILIGQIQEKRNPRKQSITYLACLSKKITEKGLGEIIKSHNLLRSTKNKSSETHDHQRPEAYRRSHQFSCHLSSYGDMSNKIYSVSI